MNEPKKCEQGMGRGCDAIHANAVEGDPRFNGWRCPEHRLSFSRALELLKEGSTITRDMERGVHVKLVLVEIGGAPIRLLILFRAFRVPEPWYPTQEDLLSNDWMVVPE